MENEVGRRRMNMIVAHFVTQEDISATQILPLNCSSSASSVIRRRDNRVSFARQGSISQACFMRPVSIKENSGPMNSCSSGFANEDSSQNVSGAPLFSRLPQMKIDQNTVKQHSPVKHECQLSMEEPPKFSRPYRGLDGQEKILSQKIGHDGIKWSPRMDVVESGCYYILTMELPGVNINSTRVEVDNINLIVKGKRPTQCWRGARGCEDLMKTYQKREILQGSYQVLWPLPSNVNKDSISAEFVDGLLKIFLPKV